MSNDSREAGTHSHGRMPCCFEQAVLDRLEQEDAEHEQPGEAGGWALELHSRHDSWHSLHCVAAQRDPSRDSGHAAWLTA